MDEIKKFNTNFDEINKVTKNLKLTFNWIGFPDVIYFALYHFVDEWHFQCFCTHVADKSSYHI